MDSSKLTGAVSAIGDKLPGMGGKGTGGFADFLQDNSRQSSQAEFEKMQFCAAMLEKYVDKVPKTSGCIRLETQDAERWKNDFLANLVNGGPKLPDSEFFKPEDSSYGIGTDCNFSCEELFQFLFRLYKAMAEYKIQKAGTDAFMKNADLFGCAEMLEKYVSRFPKTKGCVKLEGKDASDWKDRYFPNLVESGPKLPDYAFFNPADKGYGIGTDCNFSAKELFQFLYRLYKEIGKQLG